MKLRLLPLSISILVSAIVLFGGWFVYRSVAVESPITDAVSAFPGVESVKADFAKEKIVLELELAPEADLQKLMEHIRKSDQIKGRKLELKVPDTNSSEALDEWWQALLFDIAEAMEGGHYGHIPQVLADMQAELPGLQYDAAIDDTYVYVRLVHDEHVKFILLPRVSQIGVWPNE